MPKVKIKGKLVHLPYTKKGMAMAKKIHRTSAKSAADKLGY